MIFSVYLKTINKRRYWYVLRIHLFKEIHFILWNIALLTSGVLKKLISSLFHSVYLVFSTRLFPIADLFAMR